MSKTQSAVAMVRAGMTIRQAARDLDVSEQAIRREIKRQDAESVGICHCCGASLKAPKDMTDLELTVARVLQALDYTAKNSDGLEKREICADIARRLRGG